MNIESFKGSFRDVARANKFEISGFGLPDTLKVRVKSASLPSENVGTITVPYQGRQVKLAGDRTYEPWNIEVYVTNDYDIRDALTRWQEEINLPVENVGSVASSYKRDGVVDQLDVSGNVLKSIKLVGAFPQIIGAAELNWENENQILTFPATLEYDYHLSNS